MSPPTTLTQYYAEAANDAAKALTAAKNALTAATTDLTSAQSALAKAAGTLAADQAQISSIRIQLAQAQLPSDATALVAQLQASLIQTRVDQAALEQATDAAQAASRRQASAAAALPVAELAAQQATADLVASQAADIQVAAWISTVQGAVVTAALAQVDDGATMNTLQTNATNALETIIGTGMLALFKQRRDDFLAAQAAGENELTRATAALNTLLSAHEPLAGAVATARTSYEADVSQLRDLAANAVADVTNAIAALTSAATVGHLSASEQSALSAATGAAASEISAEAAVFNASATLRNDEATLDSMALGAWQTNPDFDPATDPSTSTENATIASDENALAGERTALDAVVASIDNWEVLIPDPVMNLVVAVVEAEATISRYQSVNVATLLSNLGTDEAAYAAALDALLSYERSKALIAGLVALRQADVAAAAQVAPAREATAIRGTW
jgi:hypothetical protein